MTTVKIPTRKTTEAVEAVEAVETETVQTVTVPTEPKPSRPVNEKPVEAVKPASGMPFLGIFTINNMQMINGCALPVVAYRNNLPIGVVVVSDPGMIGTALTTALAVNGYGDDIELRTLDRLSKETKLEAARSIFAQRDTRLNRDAAVTALGFSPSQLSVK